MKEGISFLPIFHALNSVKTGFRSIVIRIFHRVGETEESDL